MVAGQIATFHLVAGNEHTNYIDGPGGEPIENLTPGIDTVVTLAGHPFTYGLRAEVRADGPRVMELHIASPDHDVPLTPDDLRKVARYLDRLAYAAAVGVDVNTAAFHQPEKPLPKRPGRHGLGQEHYTEVAQLARVFHRERQVTGLSVRQRIATHYTVTEHTADKYLARARKFGFLQAGELGGKPRAAIEERTASDGQHHQVQDSGG
jgi:hypothetical protein